MYQRLYEAITTTDSDIASCGARRVWLDGTPARELLQLNQNCVLEGDAAMEALLTAHGLVQTVWNKLYRQNLIKDILFPVGLIYEDEFWSWQVIARAGRVVTIQESYYNYLQRDSSIMGSGFTEKTLLVVQAKIERQTYIEEYMPRLTDIGRKGLVYTCMHLGIQFLQAMPWKEAARHMKYLKDTVKSYPIDKAYLRTLTLKQRTHLQMLQTFFVPVCLLHSI